MLRKCANPVCYAQFQFLRQGKLFEVEIEYLVVFGNGQRDPGGSTVQIERWWLCDQCAGEVTLCFDKREGLVVQSLIRPEQVGAPVLPPSSSKTVGEVSRVLIRPLDLNLTVRRNLISRSRLQKRAAA